MIAIGGPPAAKVIKAGVHPLKHPHAIAIAELLAPLQDVLAGRPLPWFARITGARTTLVEAGA